MPKKPWEQMVIGADKSLTPNQFPFNPKTTALMKVREREVILEIETFESHSHEQRIHVMNKRNCDTPKEDS